MSSRSSRSLMTVRSSAMSECPRSIKARAHSLLPTPLEPRSITPIPRISSIVACSVVEDGEIVGDERMSTLDQGQGALAFTHAAGAAQHHADTADIEHRGMFGG